MSLRLDKILADSGLGTRSSVRDLIKSGRITVDGVIIKDSGRRSDPDREVIMCDGRRIGYAEYEYYMLNKPAGVVTATEDKREKTVLDLIDDRKRRDLFPVGRLDKDTVGLLLITNDGKLAHRLLAPGKHVEKTYRVIVEGEIGEETVKTFSEGMDIGDERLTLPSKLTILSESEMKDLENDIFEEISSLYEGMKISSAEVIITEGRFHQIKRMFETAGCRVLWLKRISMGALRLDGTLREGEYRKLSDNELKALTD